MIQGRIEFHLMASHWLRRYLVVLHLLLLLGIWVIPAPLPILLFASAAIASSFVVTWLRHIRGVSPTLLFNDGQWRLIVEESNVPIALQSPFYSSGWLVILPCRKDCGGRHTLIIPRDSLSREEYRRLRMLLHCSE